MAEKPKFDPNATVSPITFDPNAEVTPASAEQTVTPSLSTAPPPDPDPGWRDRMTQVMPHAKPTPADYANSLAALRYTGREGVKALANIGGLGLSPFLHPVDTMQSLAASVIPSSLMRGSLDDWQKKVVEPWQKAHPGQPLPAGMETSDRDRSLAETPDPFTAVAASLMPPEAVEYGKSHGRAGDLRAKQARGETLSADDQGYLDRATQLEAMGGHPIEALEGLAGQTASMHLASGLKSQLVSGALSAAEGAVRRLAGSGPGVARDLVRKAVDANENIDLHNADKVVDAKQAHADAQAKALAAHKDATLRAQQAYKEAVNAARDKAVGGTAADRAKYQSEQQAAKMQFDTEMREANDAFTKARDEAQRNNLVAENMLDLRRKAEQTLQQATDEYYAKNAAADVRAKAEENSAWSSVWKKLAGKGIDGGQVIEPLRRIMAISPETVQFLRKIPIDPEDAPLDSDFAKERAAVMKAQGYTKGYFDYPLDVRAQINRVALSHGFEPEPLDFSPQPGKLIPVEQAHRASSIIQGFIRDGRFNNNGPLRGEMIQLAKVLRASVTRTAAEAGCTAELDAARNATIARQGAFGKPPRSQVTTRSNLEKRANPEADKLREEEAELSRTRRYDPTLVDAYRQVRAAHAALDKFPEEEQLRKGLQQVPRAPNTPQLRLQPPEPGPRAENRPLPPIVYDQDVTPIEGHRTVPYREPKLLDHQTISEADLRRANEDSVRQHGSRVVGRLLTTSLAWPLWHMLSDITRGRAVSPGSLAALPAAGATGMAIEEILAHPDVNEFLTRPSRAQLAQIPLELRGRMPEIVAVAKSRGMQVSPLLVAYAAAMQRNKTGQAQQQAPPAQGVQQ